MATNWKIDPTHSEIQFKVKHLMITTVTGNFNEFDATAVTEGDDFSSVSSVDFTASIDSISTNNSQRDEHLRSADFFDASQYPALTFKSSRVEASGDDFTVTGDLTIKDTTKPVTLKAEFGGIVIDPYGQTKAGFTVSGKISRKEFGLTWSAVTEAGQVVVSDDIRLLAEIQFVKQA
ncbi:polyisoprenoid-binding protein YceI [Arcticibacter pallidicorallinus]|uniref:Polyisoprenoid-binding protein YceI n=1 Tax=Arcticibacter pallidicorallinus TaxID=1259464 RepID=A0A2T0TV43_9SPHI|nr:YceI family protein [Arcticibacter pallidicorallinus]PRY49525.1 polyisoprenoid-binding protein YceI [Arcticibacter pallidicorallinus]